MSGVLRPLLLALARDNVFVPIWSDKIGHEWRRNAARVWKVSPELLVTEWQAMEAEFPGANVSRKPTPLTGEPERNLVYSDPKDWHVILAGHQAREGAPDAEVSILTWNIKDFKRNELRRLGLGLSDPDRLLTSMWDKEPERVQSAIHRVIDELIESGRRRPEAIRSVLKRERLFQLAKRFEAKCHAD
jgi:hypothetical protein